MRRPEGDGRTPNVLGIASSRVLRQLITEGDTRAYAEWRWRLEQRTPQRRHKRKGQ